ncbi:hypothetical protein Aperf_G00000010537 [Anoplocephala perfoliata]
MISSLNNCNRKPSRRGRKKPDTLEGKSSPQRPVSSSQVQPRVYVVSTGSSASSDTNSSVLIDDRSNSASPTRSQPHPAALRALRGFGQNADDDERILVWPPPEPRPLQRQLVIPIGVIFDGPTRLRPDRNIWIFGPTAQIQQLVFENGPEEENVDDAETSREHGLVTPGTTNEESLNAEAGGEATTRGETLSPQPRRLLTALTSETRATDAEMPTETGEASEENEAQQSLGVHITPSTEGIHGAIRGEQTNTEPPPRPILYVIVDTNEGGEADDERQAAQFQFALMQLLAQLESNSDEETAPNDEEEN